MYFQEAIDAMEKGRRVRISSWPQEYFIQLNAFGQIITQSGFPFGYTVDFLKSDKWEIFKEQLDHLRNIQNVINSTRLFCSEKHPFFDFIFFKESNESIEWLDRRIKKLEENSGVRLCSF
jgi:hypothetical protein